MKRILLFTAVILALGFAACSKDDDNKKPNTNGDGTGDNITLADYEEPLTSWGMTSSQIKAALSYTLLQEKEGSLMFQGKGKVSLYMYLVGEEDSLNASSAMVSTAYSEEMAKFLTNKYIYVGNDEEDYMFYFTNENTTLAIAMQIYSPEELLIMYIPYNQAASFSTLHTNTVTDNEAAASIFARLSAHIDR